MKKRFCVAFFLGAILFCSYSQKKSSSLPVQFLMPKTAYIGDRCELKYVFHSDADLFSNVLSDEEISTLDLDTNWSGFSKQEKNCFVYKATLEHIGFEYTLTLYFIPWKSGTIDFATFDLAELVRKSQGKDEEGAEFLVDLESVHINSLVEKLGVTALRPSRGPMILPGTAFILVVLSVCFLIFAAVLVYIAIRIPVLLLYFASTKEQRKLKKLKKNILNTLKKLLRSKKDDEYFCQKLSFTIKDFLTRRFTSDFDVLTTGMYYNKFEEISCGSLSERQNQAVTDVIEVLQRCDYIRFAKGSIDSRREPSSLYETVLGEGERKLLVNRFINALDIFSKEENEEEK